MTLPGTILIHHDAGAGSAGTDRYVAALVRGLEAEGCEILRSGQESNSGWVDAVGRFRRLRRLRRQARPGVVHVHGIRGAPAPLLAALRGAGPVILTVHGFGLFCPTGRGILPSGRGCVAAFGRRCLRDGCLRPPAFALESARDRLTLGALSRWVHRTIAPSLAMWRTLEEKRIRSHYLPNFMPCNPARSPLPFGAPPEIFCVAPVRREDAALLAAAMRIVLGATEGVTLRVAGSADPLRREADREGVSRSVVVDSGTDEGALEAGIRRSSVVAYPASSNESCPPLLLEAMAHERPIVAARIGGIPELVEDGENGLLVPPGSAEALAKALLAVLLDGDRAREMGERGKRRVRARFSEERHIREILKIYRELLWGRSPRSGDAVTVIGEAG